MTCIIGIVDKDGIIYMGADSLGSDDWGRSQVRKDPKLFQVGEYLFGCAGSYRMSQILRFTIKRYPKPKEGQDIFEFMCTAFIDRVRKECKKKGYTEVKNNTESTDSNFLIGFRGRLFYVDYDFQVGESVDDFIAIGSGESIANGSLYTTRGSKDPEVRITTALEAAERYMASVRRPFLARNSNDKKRK